MEGANVGEVGEGGQVGHLGPKGYECIRENSRNKVKNFEEQFNFLVRV